MNSSLFVLHSSLNSIHRFRIFLWNILLNHQIVDDEVLALHGILSHIVFQKLLNLVVLMQRNLLQTHIRTYEMSKLLRRNLAETLESGDFRVWSEFTDSLLALFVTITIVGNEIALLLLGSQLGIGISHSLLVLDLGTLVAHTEQWGLQYINMALLDEVWEKL